MPEDLPDHTLDLRRAVRSSLDTAWQPEGYTAPNSEVYPWLWLWDSCFHSLIWLALDEPERGRRELQTALSTIDDTGFVPHMGYQRDPNRAVELWGRQGSSSITQPPMYGHALAEYQRAGIDLPRTLLARARAGLQFLIERRHRTNGLIEVVHPWETGCDDSPRWDDLCPGQGFDRERWRDHKMGLLAPIKRGNAGEPLHNPAFPVASVGFNALVAWNAKELADVTGDDALAEAASEIVARLDARFDVEHATWIDAGPTAAGSGRARTADALLPVLVTERADARAAVTAALLDPGGHASAHGPRGVHACEPTFSPTAYWRGPVWPQLAYLLWVAFERGGDVDAAATIRTSTIAGAVSSGLAEYWDGDSGRGLGAAPQSWAGLVLVDSSG